MIYKTVWINDAQGKLLGEYYIDLDSIPLNVPEGGSYSFNKPIYVEPVNTDPNIAKIEIIQKRNKLLTNTDWVVTRAMDQGTQVPEAWSTYRQQLRDITQQTGYPFTVTWPTPPQQ
jgi:hypothetical protein